MSSSKGQGRTSAELRKAFLSSPREQAASGPGSQIQNTGGPAPKSMGRPSALPAHMQSVGASASPSGGLEASSGLSKSLSDLDIQTGRLKEDTSIEQLKEVQRRLRQDVADKRNGIEKLEKISVEVTVLLQQHQQLQEAASKRERLGQTMRQRLDERCQKLEGTNRQLNGQLEQERIHPGSTLGQAREDMKEELAKRDQMIRSLESQHDTCVSNIEQLQQQYTRLQQDMAWLGVLQRAVGETDSKLQTAEEELVDHVNFNARLPELESQFHVGQTAATQYRSEHKELVKRLGGQVAQLTDQLCSSGDELLALRLSMPPAIMRDLEQLVVQRDQLINILKEEVFRWQQLYMDEIREGTALSETVSLDIPRPASTENHAHAVGKPSSSMQHLHHSSQRLDEMHHRRRQQELRTALQHQVQLEAGLRTLDHIIAQHEMELLEIERQRTANESSIGGAGGSDSVFQKYATPAGARSLSASGAATPSSVCSFPMAGQALRTSLRKAGSTTAIGLSPLSGLVSERDRRYASSGAVGSPARVKLHSTSSANSGGGGRATAACSVQLGLPVAGALTRARQNGAFSSREVLDLGFQDPDESMV